MPKFLATFCLALVAILIAATTSARAVQWEGSVTNVLDGTTQETNPNGCHDNPYYFNPSFGWARTCSGGHDIGAGTGPNVYIRGYFWNNATIVNAQGNTVYADQFCSSPVGTEYNNAWQIPVPSGTIGIGFHHLDNYHYVINSTVPNGTHVGERAAWGRTVYYCSGALASTGPHVHTEAARDGNPTDAQLVDAWMFASGYPNDPFIHYEWP